MKLYLISQDSESGYDTFDSAVVCAENAADAKTIHPINSWGPRDNNGWGDNTWCKSPEQVRAIYIGKAAADLPRGVVLASFNAG